VAQARVPTPAFDAVSQAPTGVEMSVDTADTSVRATEADGV